jgi:hypothetical protein
MELSVPSPEMEICARQNSKPEALGYVVRDTAEAEREKYEKKLSSPMKLLLRISAQHSVLAMLSAALSSLFGGDFQARLSC